MPNIEIKMEQPDDDNSDNNNDDELNGHVFDYQHQTTTKKLQLHRQQLYAGLHKETHNNNNKQQPCSSNAEAASMKPCVFPSLGARCGEIFVANNANKWTFLCTFCNKTTRDIGQFVLHCSKHLQPTLTLHSNNVGATLRDMHDGDDDYEDVAARDEDDLMDAAVTSGNRSDDYLDCGSYLDVNVHTDPGDLSLRYGEQQQAAAAPLTTTINENRLGNTSTPSNKVPKKMEATTVRSPWTSQPPSEIDCGPPAQQQDTSNYGTNDCDDDIDEENDDDNQLMMAAGKEGLSVSSRERPKRRQIRGPAYCELCDKTFQYYSLYRNHMIKHSNETPFKCDLCQKSFKSKQALRYHAQTHQRDKQFYCVICRVGMTTETQYVSHMMTHENASTYPCNVCGHILGSLKERDAHMETHTKDRPFRCRVCGKLFRLRHHLSNHLKMHRQYRCDFCKTDFISSIHLRKPYACDTCLQLPDVVMRINEDDARPTKPDHDHTGFSGDEQMEADNDAYEESSVAARVGEMHDDSVIDDEILHLDSARNRSLSRSLALEPLSDRLRYTCMHCPRTYSHVNGLNYHMRKKHPPQSDI